MNKSRSIAWKLSGLIIGLFLVLFIAYTITTSSILHNQSIQDAEASAIENAELSATQMSDRFKTTNEMLRTTKNIFETLQAQGNLTTDEVLSIIENNLEHNDDAMAMAAIFEKGSIPTDSSTSKGLLDREQRFIPYLYKEENKITTEPLVDYEEEGDGDWYLIPRRENRAVLTEPYEYDTGGGTVLMTTISLPLVDDSGSFYRLFERISEYDRAR